MSENEKTYISRQISVYKTDKKLVEFIDKLKPAPAEYYAHIHSFGDKDESGVRQISCIGITLQNYTNGTGKNIKRVSANISPDEAEYIFNQLQNAVQEFNFQQEKIFGTPDENGRSHVTKLRIIRAVTGSDGAHRCPWAQSPTGKLRCHHIGTPSFPAPFLKPQPMGEPAMSDTSLPPGHWPSCGTLHPRHLL